MQDNRAEWAAVRQSVRPVSSLDRHSSLEKKCYAFSFWARHKTPLRNQQMFSVVRSAPWRPTSSRVNFGKLAPPLQEAFRKKIAGPACLEYHFSLDEDGQVAYLGLQARSEKDPADSRPLCERCYSHGLEYQRQSDCPHVICDCNFCGHYNERTTRIRWSFSEEDGDFGGQTWLARANNVFDPYSQDAVVTFINHILNQKTEPDSRIVINLLKVTNALFYVMIDGNKCVFYSNPIWLIYATIPRELQYLIPSSVSKFLNMDLWGVCASLYHRLDIGNHYYFTCETLEDHHIVAVEVFRKVKCSQYFEYCFLCPIGQIFKSRLASHLSVIPDMKWYPHNSSAFIGKIVGLPFEHGRQTEAMLAINLDDHQKNTMESITLKHYIITIIAFYLPISYDPSDPSKDGQQKLSQFHFLNLHTPLRSAIETLGRLDPLRARSQVVAHNQLEFGGIMTLQNLTMRAVECANYLAQQPEKFNERLDIARDYLFKKLGMKQRLFGCIGDLLTLAACYSDLYRGALEVEEMMKTNYTVGDLICNNYCPPVVQVKKIGDEVTREIFKGYELYLKSKQQHEARESFRPVLSQPEPLSQSSKKSEPESPMQIAQKESKTLVDISPQPQVTSPVAPKNSYSLEYCPRLGAPKFTISLPIEMTCKVVDDTAEVLSPLPPDAIIVEDTSDENDD